MHLCNVTQTMYVTAITDVEQCSVAKYNIQYIGGYFQGNIIKDNVFILKAYLPTFKILRYFIHQ